MADFNEIDALLANKRSTASEPATEYPDEPQNHVIEDEFGDQDTSAAVGENRTYFTRLTSLWLTEENSPELLPFGLEIVSEIEELLKFQQDLIDQKSSYARSQKAALTSTLLQMDVDRFRFVLLSYLRLRLKKITSHPLHYSAGYGDRMSPAEKVFCDRYVDVFDMHFTESVLKYMPEYNDLKNLDAKEMTEIPDLKKYVFARVISEGELFVRELLGESLSEMEATFQKSDILIARYEKIKGYVEAGVIELIG